MLNRTCLTPYLNLILYSATSSGLLCSNSHVFLYDKTSSSAAKGKQDMTQQVSYWITMALRGAKKKILYIEANSKFFFIPSAWPDQRSRLRISGLAAAVIEISESWRRRLPDDLPLDDIDTSESVEPEVEREQELHRQNYSVIIIFIIIMMPSPYWRFFKMNLQPN